MQQMCGDNGKGRQMKHEHDGQGQLLKPLAPNSSSVDGVDNPPRDPVRHTSVSDMHLGVATLIVS